VGTYSNGVQSVITAKVTWSSSNSGVGGISSIGLLTAAAPGTTDVSATFGGFSSQSVTVTVTAAPTTTS
jgi:hypothetical protein